METPEKIKKILSEHEEIADVMLALEKGFKAQKLHPDMEVALKSLFFFILDSVLRLDEVSKAGLVNASLSRTAIVNMLMFSSFFFMNNPHLVEAHARFQVDSFKDFAKKAMDMENRIGVVIDDPKQAEAFRIDTESDGKIPVMVVEDIQ